MPAKISVVGLGSGSFKQLTVGVWERLQSGLPVYLRTNAHPIAADLEARGLKFRTLDEYYERSDDFASVYEEIVQSLMDEALEKGGELIYAVPGHPSVAEAAVKLLRERCPQAGVLLAIEGGESFLDQAFLRFGFDPVEGFVLLDASGLDSALPDPRLHLFITQVYDRFTASEAKLALMERYPPDYQVVAGHELGVPGKERLVHMALFELDRCDDYGNASVIWVPRSEDERLRYRSFDFLKEIVAVLRSPQGCPWDREQTHASLKKNLIEEAYEVLETIDDDDPDAMREELGDLLLQVMLHAQMEAETGAFEAADVVQTLNEKLIRRHPHVFGDTKAGNAEEALRNWEAVKKKENSDKPEDKRRRSVLEGVPKDLPALLKAYKIQKKASAVGFDWDELDACMDKVAEEYRELAAETQSTSPDRAARLQDELGDLLFAAVNVARFLKIDPEEALSGTIRKFRSRFEYIEEQLRLEGRNFGQTELQEMELLWQQAKQQNAREFDKNTQK